MTVKGKHGLGKGLDSMIPAKKEKIVETVNVDNNVSRETLIDINSVEPNRDQPRRKFNEDSLHELAESIKEFGVIQPLIVQKKEDYYEIIAGERRWRAARIAGIKTVPVIIKDYSPQEVIEIALIENIQREDLNPIEEAMAYKKLIDDFSLRQDEVADKVSKSRVSITNSLRLLKLDKNVQQMLIDDMISSGHARALLALTDLSLQNEIAMTIIDEKLSVRETEKLVKQILQPKEVKKKVIKKQDNSIYRDLEEKLKNSIGSKVNINRKNNNKGKIEIEYYSEEDLERIVELFFLCKNNG
ncbi:ParB/RepB/Spo0J family partition protein [Anaeromicropila populeti]|uniref:Chromosome partitioning protein, ParB family n=1 Tax=Anaeromicropila populeti TaxID=37658 RepID=A0A1I6LN05_9FIRM|nr:ParB/RepB/Spo0J family partition protein [Anaeromicropila populeti]SFS04660.1 chromosome partitioning protein, ParB family [Anaeromicropila populeti]